MSEPGGLPMGVVVGATLALLAVACWMRGLRPSRRAVGLLGVVAVLSAPLASPASAATVLLPDLISDQPDPSGPVEVNTYTGTPRLILRFDGYVTNVGDGPLEVSGNPQILDPADDAGVRQRAIDSDGNWSAVGAPLVQYETADGHNHFHLMEVGRYSLWNEAKTAEVAPGQKVGFCLYDIGHAEPEDWTGPHPDRLYSGEVTQFCDSEKPDTTDLVMGVSAGWRDLYGAYLTFQWIDVSDTAPGIYYLANEADPWDRIVESDETNNQVGFAEKSSLIPGYNARPVGPVATDGDSVEVELVTEAFGSPGNRGFRIVTPPARGTVDVATGVAFSSASVTYTPEPGFAGIDSFEYVAFDEASDYPLNPTRASASLRIGDPDAASVDISGAPASVVVGTSADLEAAVANAPDVVTWSVDGVPGGNATVGRIDGDGLYRAPAAVPAAGSVVIRAALEADPSVYDEIVLDIRALPNNAPVIVAPEDQDGAVGDTARVVIGASDPDGDAFEFSATGLPPGSQIHPTNGVISGTLTAPGEYAVTVIADDGTDRATAGFDWTVTGVAAPPGGFVDVPAGTYYSAAVNWMADQGITTGMGDGRFEPMATATRAQMATFLWRDAGSPGGSPSAGFGDVVAGSFYEEAVDWLAASGITTGVDEDRFAPDDPVTRAQMATFLWRRAGSPGGSPSAGFGDVVAGSFYEEAVDWLAASGITTGVGDNRFAPDDPVTRAQIATFLWRAAGSP